MSYCSGCADRDSQIAALQADLKLATVSVERLTEQAKEEKERADSNYASCERIKEEYSDCWNELKAARESLLLWEQAADAAMAQVAHVERRLEYSHRMQDYLIAGEREALASVVDLMNSWAQNADSANADLRKQTREALKDAEAAETALAAANEKLAGLTGRIGKIIETRSTYADSNLDCPKSVKDWIAAENCALRAALAAALEERPAVDPTRTNSSVLDGLRDAAGAEGRGTADAE